MGSREARLTAEQALGGGRQYSQVADLSGGRAPADPAEVSIAADGPAKAAGIERRRGLSYAEFERDYLRANKPVILCGAMDEWAALDKWSPEFFKRGHAAAPVTVEGEPTTLGAFIDEVLASTAERPSRYLRDKIIREIAPELLRDIEPFCEYSFPNWLPGFYLLKKFRGLFSIAQIELFIGGVGTRLGEIHYDYIHVHNVLCQIYGRKEFTIFPPDDADHLYACVEKAAFSNPNAAIKNPDDVDLARFPLFAKARPIRFVQEPGEIVFLPSGWWHATRLLTASIAVGVTFANETNWPALTQDFRNSPMAAKVPGVRPLLSAYLAALAGVRRKRGRWAGVRELGIVPANFSRETRSSR